MAHHIAGLMMKAKNVTGAERNIVERQCADTILKLWSHRASFQSGRRPLGSFEPIFHMLAKMFNKRKPFYFSEPSTEDNEWLRLAEATDDVARQIIRFSLAMASEQAGSQEKNWLGLASQLNIQTDLEANLIKKLLQDSQGLGEDAQKPHQGTERLKRFQERLSTFQNIIKELSETIDNMLTQTNKTERTLSQKTRPRRESRPRRGNQ